MDHGPWIMDGVLFRPARPPPTARWGEVDDQRHDDAGHRPEAPLAAPPLLDCGIPEEGRGKEEKPENRPERRVVDPLEEVAEPPGAEDDKARGGEGKQGEETGHGRIPVVSN